MINQKPMKVLQVVGAMNRAGTETMLMNIYRNIDREKIQFDFVSYNLGDAHYDQEIRQLGGKVIKLTKTGSIRELYKAIKKYGPYDVVHSHTLFHCGIANVAALLAGIKIRIAHAHTTLDNSESFLRRTYIKFMRTTIRTFSTNLLACSHGAGTYLFGEGKLVDSKYTYFPNAIDYGKFLDRPAAEVKKFKVEQGLGNSIVIGHVGRFMEAKNHRFLLEVMKEVIKRDASIKLLLVGDGVLRQQMELESKKDGLNDNIKFVGVRSDISTMLHSMDVFVFPSLYEGLGLVLLEAQASGIPCIVSDAIQPEADVNIDLVSKVSLSDGPNAWVDRIFELVNKKEKNRNKIVKAFEESGYSLPEGISWLTHIYNNQKEGGAYERDIGSLL